MVATDSDKQRISSRKLKFILKIVLSSLCFTKSKKLEKPQYFLQWFCHVKVVISRRDPTFSFEEGPESDDEDYDVWVTLNAKSKATTILCFGETNLPKTRELVDRDGIGKQL